ncbi:MAG TPA: cupin-like domain-containing protein [Bacteroidia bacterium]|nr:cupin-like domain-containing protein [Bacteroidia bacterium]
METYRRNIKPSQRFEYGVYQVLDQFFGRERMVKLLGGRRKAFYKRLHKTLKKSGDGKTIEIERRTDLSLKEFRKNYLKKGIPVIMEGAANEWDCVKKWSFEYFKQLHGTDEVAMLDDKDKKNFEIMTLADIMDNIQGGGKKYYRFYPLLSRHPEHIKDFDYEWLRERRNNNTLIEEFRVMMGGKDTTTGLHIENRGNLFVQTYGEKKWILYPPYYTSVLDPKPVRFAYRSVQVTPEKGGFNPFNPKYEPPYNLYKYIDHYETILKPGDVLWVPTFYWHTVVNTTNSIGVGYRWFNLFVGFKTAPLYMFLDFVSTKPPIWKVIKLFKEDINVLLIAQRGKLDKYRKESEGRIVIPKVKVTETVK